MCVCVVVLFVCCCLVVCLLLFGCCSLLFLIVVYYCSLFKFSPFFLIKGAFQEWLQKKEKQQVQAKQRVRYAYLLLLSCFFLLLRFALDLLTFFFFFKSNLCNRRSSRESCQPNWERQRLGSWHPNKIICSIYWIIHSLPHVHKQTAAHKAFPGAH